MFKIIYLPEALVSYVETIRIDPSTGINQRVFCGRWKDKSKLEIALQEYYFFKHHQTRNNVDIIFARKELPKRKVPLSRHLFEIMEFPDV
jgi:hypothetical protein